ncbi:MAG: hypothetical protein N3A02_07085, partial [Rectinema sp.]|nr:hypothetical protein [Rectinema sp.]
VYVFTILMIQMLYSDARAGMRSIARFPWKDIFKSGVLWAIGGGIAISLLLPDLQRFLTAPRGFFAAITSMVGGMTSPLVCLVIGASLRTGTTREPAAVKLVLARTLVGLATGSVIAFVVVPALGFSSWHGKAAMVLFALPPPFIIPVYYRDSAALIGSVLTITTACSVIMVSVLVFAGVA